MFLSNICVALFEKETLKAEPPLQISGFSFCFLSSNESERFGEITGFIPTLLEKKRNFLQA